jgi:hypothetical protein
VAVIGPPNAGTVNVQFLFDTSDPKNEEILDETKKELQFYLIDKMEPNGWGYMQYHCGTSANVYSNVHWSFFNAKS